jgi:YD repeat-containing protein
LIERKLLNVLLLDDEICCRGVEGADCKSDSFGLRYNTYSIFKEYNERGDLLSDTNPLGQKRTFAYKNRGRCIEETSFSQNLREEKRYDTKGRLLEERTIGEDGIHTVSYQYDCNDLSQLMSFEAVET